jgi:hypothetical protein
MPGVALITCAVRRSLTTRGQGAEAAAAAALASVAESSKADDGFDGFAALAAGQTLTVDETPPGACHDAPVFSF